jgi:lipoprotein Spr
VETAVNRETLMIKNCLLAFFVALVFCSCSVVKNNYVTNNSVTNNRTIVQSIPFNKGNSGESIRPYPSNSNKKISSATEMDKPESLCIKYAGILGVAPSSITNIDLMREIDDWYGVPYEYGGDSKNGIDCSGFVQMLEMHVYCIQLPRTSGEQYLFCRHINAKDLQEGDLVFFGRKHVSHVGVYLRNGKFVHASTTDGVMISTLNEPYWQKIFIAGGRIL